MALGMRVERKTRYILKVAGHMSTADAVPVPLIIIKCMLSMNTGSTNKSPRISCRQTYQFVEAVLVQCRLFHKVAPL